MATVVGWMLMNVGVVAYIALVLVIAAGRLGELGVSRRHLAWARARGGIEHGPGHYPVMVALHAGLLAGCVVEVTAGGRPFLPGLGWPMLALLVAAHGLRWWCIRALGQRWTTRVMVIPDLPLVTRGPYRWLRHPNYLAVIVEGAALPLVYSAWLTALVFTMANLALLRVRVRVEQAALAVAAPATTAVAGRDGRLGEHLFDPGLDGVAVEADGVDALAAGSSRLQSR